MHFVLILIALAMFAVFAPPMLTAAVAVAFLCLTYVTEQTAKLLTGASIGTGEAARSVGLAFLFLFLYCLMLSLSAARLGSASIMALAAQQFGGLGLLGLMLGFFAAYIAGFKLGMNLGLVQASVVALVTSVASVLLVNGLRYLV